MQSILLVDDERWVRTALRKVIERCDQPFQIVQECANGLEAIDWLTNHEADLIMTDVRMPIMDGVCLVKELREKNKQSEIIMISGYDDFQYVQFALRNQVADYLLKPVEVEDMNRCLTMVSSRQSRMKTKQHMSAATKGSDEKLESSAIQQVIYYIQSTIPGEITLQEAAAKVHLNPSYLSQLFKQQMKMNFVEYVLEQRMERAKRLLANTCLRISEVAERVGYADLAYFSNAFKRVTGKTPTEFRKNDTPA
jgi:YesN/AraC family two-component response regulator